MAATEPTAATVERETDLRVLQVATTERSFFTQQVEALEARGVSCTTVTVPHPDEGSRGPLEYARFYAETVREAVAGHDLVHANYGLVGPLALAQPVRPVVLTLWGSELLSDRGWLDRWSRVAARHSDAVVVPSQRLAAELDESHDLVPFGVDTERFRPIDRARARERVGWVPDRRHVLFPYDPTRPVKNFPRAERVVGRLPDDVVLQTVSGVAYDEMPYYMNASDALLVASDYESGPMVVKEAAACNVPVVSTDVGFVAEVLDGVSNSAVARSESALVDALSTVLGRRSDGRSTVDTLGVDQMAEQLLGTYRRVLTG
ncbi:glycosyltransferase family 4 protein [Halorarius litoreus]|uniref:glycosyltransferase family 4 protein n=1 Tax=Halorarius litoreus TaxID=2962676 RepID=UPI0020CD9A3B|nr:glycosyltransferase family 4 protein [Halorarius litoreus]